MTTPTGSKPDSSCFSFRQTGACDFQIEHLEDRRADDTRQFGRLSANVVRNSPAGPVGAQGQGDPRLFPINHMIGIRTVACCKNMIIRCVHSLVDGDGVFHADFKTRTCRQFAVWFYSDGHQDHIRCEGLAGADEFELVSAGFNSINAVPRKKSDLVVLPVLF